MTTRTWSRRNWTHVRKLPGWERYDSAAAVEAINDIYRQELGWWMNLYLPSVKLVKKVSAGPKVRRVYYAAQTPLERVLAGAQARPEQMAELKKLRQSLDPFALGKAIDGKLERIYDLANRRISPQGTTENRGAQAKEKNTRPAKRLWKSRDDGGASVTFPISRRQGYGYILNWLDAYTEPCIKDENVARTERYCLQKKLEINAENLMPLLINRLTKSHIWRRIGIERIGEPVHFNIASALVALFGTFRARVAFDLVMRHPLAFGLLQAADWATECGISQITAIELGVANGAGLVNMCAIAAKVSKVTGVSFDIVGFDTGKGMPPPKDFRDHPEFYGQGDFPMENRAALQNRLPANATIVIGEVADTIKPFLEGCATIGFISVDLDYYHSTLEALQLLDAAPDKYLPWVVMYFDDVEYDRHNPFCGELAAIEEFNKGHSTRKIAKFNLLRQRRIFQRATWIEHMYIAHVFDHAFRSRERTQKRVLDNPFS